MENKKYPVVFDTFQPSDYHKTYNPNPYTSDIDKSFIPYMHGEYENLKEAKQAVDVLYNCREIKGATVLGPDEEFRPIYTKSKNYK